MLERIKSERVIFLSYPISEILGGSIEKINPVTWILLMRTAQAVSRVIIFHENIHAACVIIFSAGKLGTMS